MTQKEILDKSFKLLFVIICIGNALVDSLEQIEEFVIDELNLNKARMTLVDKERSNFLLQNMKNPVYEAGGSAANTAYWISQLGGKVGFIGKISNDDLGKQFKSSLKDSGLNDYTVLRVKIIKLDYVQSLLLLTVKEQ